MTYNYAIGAPFAATGTVAYTSGNGEVVGTGTAFLSEFQVSDVVYINGHYRLVFSVVSDTQMFVGLNWDDSASGQAVVGYAMQRVENDLSLPAPKGVFVPYSQPLDLGNGGVRGAGWATAEWRWGFLTRDQRDDLRPLAAGASARVVIYTTTNENNDEYSHFVGYAIWPQAEERDAGRRRAFVLRFRALVEIL